MFTYVPSTALLTTFQGFDRDRHTIHLGLSEPEGLIIQVTDTSVKILEPQGLLQIGCWHQPELLLKAQFGATAGRLIAVVCKSTMILLEVEAPTSSEAERAVRELHRVELDDPVSALAMRTIGDAQTWAGAFVIGAEAGFIANFTITRYCLVNTSVVHMFRFVVYPIDNAWGHDRLRATPMREDALPRGVDR